MTVLLVDITPQSNDIAIRSRPNKGSDVELTNSDLYNAIGKGKFECHGLTLCVKPYQDFENRNYNRRVSKLDIFSLLALSLPTSTLTACILSYVCTNASGWDAVFPSVDTVHIVWKLTIWITLATVVVHEQSHFWRSGQIEVEVSIIDCTSFENTDPSLEIKAEAKDPNIDQRPKKDCADNVEVTSANTMETYPPNEDQMQQQVISNEGEVYSTKIKDDSSTSTKLEDKFQHQESSPPDLPSPCPDESTTTIPTASSEDTVPFRFIRATKGDLEAAKVRYNSTLKWRQEIGMDTILQEPHKKFDAIKANYPHFFHLRGKKNECCYFEKPAKMNLKRLKQEGIKMDDLLRHYALCCEYMWTKIESGEDGRSIYVIDLEGIGFRDFAGEVVDFTKRASSFTAEHYPERSGSIFVINVPSWFSIIWSVVKPMVDEVTKEKISILKVGKDAITKALAEKIPMKNIPPEYGGESVSLGCSPEEDMFRKHFAHLNEQVKLNDNIG